MPHRLSRRALRLGLAGLLAVGLGPAAAADPAQLCDAAAARAAAATGVPLPVLQAIALTETGRSRGGRMRPWPWTTHAAGEGRWFDSRATAEAHVQALRAQGRRSIDIGCFQVNLRWHGDGFASPAAMFDPEANALYAARFLAGLKAEFGSWEAAAGAYHSRTPHLAARYTARFRQHLAALASDPPPPDRAPQRSRAAAGPLLQPATAPLLGGRADTGGSRMPGSLVTATAAAGGLLGPGARALQ